MLSVKVNIFLLVLAEINFHCSNDLIVYHPVVPTFQTRHLICSYSLGVPTNNFSENPLRGSELSTWQVSIRCALIFVHLTGLDT